MSAAADGNVTANGAPAPTLSVAIAKPANGTNGYASGGAAAARASTNTPTPPRGVFVPAPATTTAPAVVSTAVTATDFPYPATHYAPHEFDAFVRALFRSAFGFDARTDADKEAADKAGAALTFGEVLPSGVAKMLDRAHLNARTAKVLYDIGCGFGKLALQAFLRYDNLDKVVGVEICESRYLHAAQTLRRLAAANPAIFTLTTTTTTVTIAVASPRGGKRTLQLRNHNLFDTKDVNTADVVICETAFPYERQGDLTVLLSGLKSGARFLLYHQLSHLPGAVIGYDAVGVEATAELHDAKDASRRVLAKLTAITPSETYAASWFTVHFDTWRKV